MVDAELTELYQAPLAEFTALRSRLAAAAKKRGDAASAKQITAARKPSTSAWVVNRLVHDDPEVRKRLSDLGERLRAAHTAMDGHLIRELSGEQRRLVDGLRRAAMQAAGMDSLSGTLRNDVTDTLQAAVADPDVTARIGWLARAEHWLGFGEVDDSTAVFAPAESAASTESTPRPAPTNRKARASIASAPASRDDAADREQREQREQARAAFTAAQRAKSDADAALTELQSDLATARIRLEDARQRLTKAEAAAEAAEQTYRDAKQVSRDATTAVKTATAQLAKLPPLMAGGTMLGHDRQQSSTSEG